MPEQELHRDLFGANLGSSCLELARELSRRIKKRIDDIYFNDHNPPYRPMNDQFKVIFVSLGFNRSTIEIFWHLFCRICNGSDTIKLEHFLEHFRLDWTPWTERCFNYFDVTGRGQVDFVAFMISVWSICTLNVDTLSNFSFDMYDLDSDGELSIPEIERMVHELFGVGGGQKCLKEAIDFAKDRGGVLTL